MKDNIFLLLVCLPLLISTFGCNPDSPLAVSFNPPTCAISSIQKTDASWPYPAKISMTVGNTGDATAFDVECEIKLKSGNTIVDEGFIYFGTLASHESYAQDARFWNITSHSEYSSAEYHLFWFDSQGEYHD
jgi:hypothetical protein